MGSFDSRSAHSLDDEQIERLATIFFEDFGLAPGRIQFHDIVLMMFEDIAGFDLPLSLSPCAARASDSMMLSGFIDAMERRPYSLNSGVDGSDSLPT